jgi:hypothetical protein
MANGKKFKVLRIVVGISLVILLAIGGFSLYVSQHYKRILKERLPGWIAKTTDSCYFISVRDVSINILTRRVTVYDVKVWPDSAHLKELDDRGLAPAQAFHIHVPKVEVTNIMWENVLADQSLDVGKVIVWQPKVIMTAFKKDSAQLAQDSVKKAARKETKTAYVQKVSAQQIEILQPDVTYHFGGADSFFLYLKGGKIELNDWSFDRDNKTVTNRFLYAKTATIITDSMLYDVPNGLYSFSTGQISFGSDQRHVEIEKLSFKPKVSKDEFYRRTGHQKEIYTMDFPKVAFAGFDWQSMMTGKKLIVDTAYITDPNLDIYLSRMYPATNESKLGKYPHQLLNKLKMPVNIQTLVLKNGNFKYTEVSDKTHMPGTLNFNDISGNITNITNIDSLQAINKNCTIALAGKFMHRSPMTATFNLLLTDKAGFFTVDGTLKDLDADEVNAQAKALAMAEIKSFHLSRMDMHVQGNEKAGSGSFTLLYTDLDVDLKKKDEDTKQLKSKKLLSFMANTLLIYPSNPMPEKEMRKVNTSIPRDPHKSFFSLIWKNIFQGAQRTALRNPGLIESIKDVVKPNKDGKDKGGEKKGILHKIFDKKDKKDKK